MAGCRALHGFPPVAVLAWSLVYDAGVSAAQNSVENQLVHDVSAGSDGVATTIICGVDPRLKADWLRDPARAWAVRMVAVSYVSDAVEIHYCLERGQTDFYADRDVPVCLGDVRVDADGLVTVGIPRRLRNFYCVRTEGRPPDFALDVVGSVQDPWRDWPAKAEHYAAVGVRECWRFDMTGESLNPRLQGFRLQRGEYVALPSNGEGGELEIRSEVLGLDLRWCNERLQVKDPSTGRVYQSLENVRELQALEKAAERGEREAAARLKRTQQMITEVFAKRDAVLGALPGNGGIPGGADLPAG